MIVIGLITVFFGFHLRDLKLSYELPQMLPDNHPALVAYGNFKKEFGQDGAVMFAGALNADIFNLDQFNALYDLSHRLQEIEGELMNWATEHAVGLALVRPDRQVFGICRKGTDLAPQLEQLIYRLYLQLEQHS